MKIVFLLDNKTFLEVAPEQIQLRQVEAGLAALIVPAGTKNEAGEDLFHPLITFPVVLTAAPKPEPIQAGVAPAVPTDAPAPTDISTGKKRAAKKKAVSIQ